MTRPEEALAAARRTAAEYADADGPQVPIRLGPPRDQIAARLSEWAVADPTSYEVRSIRRYGAPITAFKRLLLRLLLQFHSQLISDQSRFNIVLLDYVRSLEARIQELEARLSIEPAAGADAVEEEQP